MVTDYKLNRLPSLISISFLDVAGWYGLAALLRSWNRCHNTFAPRIQPNSTGFDTFDHTGLQMEPS